MFDRDPFKELGLPPRLGFSEEELASALNSVVQRDPTKRLLADRLRKLAADYLQQPQFSPDPIPQDYLHLDTEQDTSRRARQPRRATSVFEHAPNPMLSAVAGARSQPSLVDLKQAARLFQLALQAFDARNFFEAEKALQEAAQLDPSCPQTLFNLALALYFNGKFDAAEDLFERLVAVYDHEKAKKILQLLKPQQ